MAPLREQKNNPLFQRVSYLWRPCGHAV